MQQSDFLSKIEALLKNLFKCSSLCSESQMLVYRISKLFTMSLVLFEKLADAQKVKTAKLMAIYKYIKIDHIYRELVKEKALNKPDREALELVIIS